MCGKCIELKEEFLEKHLEIISKTEDELLVAQALRSEDNAEYFLWIQQLRAVLKDAKKLIEDLPCKTDKSSAVYSSIAAMLPDVQYGKSYN